MNRLDAPYQKGWPGIVTDNSILEPSIFEHAKQRTPLSIQIAHSKYATTKQDILLTGLPILLVYARKGTLASGTSPFSHRP